MSYHDSSQIYGRPTVYGRPAAKFSVRQLLPGRELLDWSRNKVLVLAVGKVLLLVVGLTMVLQFGIASLITRLDGDITTLKDQRHQLVDDNIMLRAQRAIVYSPENIQRMAAEQLGLRQQKEGQVAHYNRATGDFVYN
jgi:hypothetical protein